MDKIMSGIKITTTMIMVTKITIRINKARNEIKVKVKEILRNKKE